MAAAVLLPVAVFSAVALALLLEAARVAANGKVYDSVQLVSMAVDQELAAAEKALRVLASSEKLGRADLEGFHERLTRTGQSADTWIVLRDARGGLLLTSRLPYKTPLPPPSFARQAPGVLSTRSVVVSDLFVGALVQRPIVTLSIAVETANGPAILSRVFLPAYFNRILADAHLPQSWAVRLLDRQGSTIARPPGPQQVVGQAVDLRVLEAARRQGAGELRHQLDDHVDVFDAFALSPLSGWTLAAGVPAAEIEGPALRAVALAALGLLVTLMTGVWLAFANARRLADSVAGAARAAAMIGHASSQPPPGVQLEEIASLHEAMHRAHLNLMDEKNARAAAEAGRAALHTSEQAARTVAEAQNRGKDMFLAMLGHELRNPLSAITGAAEVIRLRGGTAVMDHAHSVIERQAAHLARIVDDLLDVTRVISGKVRLDLQPVELGAKVRRVLATLEAAGRTRHHAVDLRLGEAWVAADATRLEQIANNLLANAFKHTPESGTVTVTVTATDTEAVLAVHDTGVGIEAALLPDIFGIFVQGAPSVDRAQGGLGIGLALVKQLVELHGATVSAESPGPGRGSTFTVRFPRIEAPRNDSVETLPVFRQPLRVLVVEDHADARDMLRELLELSGHGCVTANDGSEGLLQAAAARPDAAVIDIGLPGLNGYELAARLRGDPSTQDIYLIALTGYGQQHDRQRALAAGFDTHLIKPVNAAMLLRVLDAVAPRE